MELTAGGEGRGRGRGSGHGGWLSSGDGNSGILDEQILVLVFGQLNWDPSVVCVAAQVSRRLRAVANRVLWREVCISRAPRMVAALTSGTQEGSSRVGGGWNALAKLLFYCSGGGSSLYFPLPSNLPGHFAGVSRFSKTSGLSFLSRRCSGDLLFMSDPCEHADVDGAPDGEDLGAYRGVYRGFIRSKTRANLIGRQADLEQRIRCPYCRARVWSMTAARLVPRTAARRLAAQQGRLEYFVCVNGHLHGNCWLAHLSSDDGDSSGQDDDGGGDRYEGGDEGDDARIAC
ncbi:EID1-like F-box protein 3 [Platanthera guangdongensis]|uniref:EID1-like F-box protein 3 n=1 Tax=Platanthera guangdongensis TaxID=2320717 RepID=A0ABR2MAN2_9ASPA